MAFVKADLEKERKELDKLISENEDARRAYEEFQARIALHQKEYRGDAMLNYKGYIGKAEYDDENHVFTGCVINVKTVITFQGSTVDEIENNFKTSIDDYLDWCREDGVPAENPSLSDEYLSSGGKSKIRTQ